MLIFELAALLAAPLTTRLDASRLAVSVLVVVVKNDQFLAMRAVLGQ